MTAASDSENGKRPIKNNTWASTAKGDSSTPAVTTKAQDSVRISATAPSTPSVADQPAGQLAHSLTLRHPRGHVLIQSNGRFSSAAATVTRPLNTNEPVDPLNSGA